MFQIPPALARSTLDAAPDAMLIIDTSGIICVTNRQFPRSRLPARRNHRPAHREVAAERFRAQHIGHRERYVDNVRMRPMGFGSDLFGRRRTAAISPRNQPKPHRRCG